MRTFIRSAIAFAVVAISFASSVHALDLPVNCKNPAECSIKFN